MSEINTQVESIVHQCSSVLLHTVFCKVNTSFSVTYTNEGYGTIISFLTSYCLVFLQRFNCNYLDENCSLTGFKLLFMESASYGLRRPDDISRNVRSINLEQSINCYEGELISLVFSTTKMFLGRRRCSASWNEISSLTLKQNL